MPTLRTPVFGSLRDHRRERDERRRVARPAALDRQARRDRRRRPRGRSPGTAPFETTFGRESATDFSFESPLTFSRRSLRRLEVEDVGELRGGVVERLDAEREAHAPLRPELVDEERVLRALRVLEEERRPARLHDPVDDLRDLEVGIGLGRDPPQLALALEERDPLAQVSGRRATARSVYGASASTTAGSRGESGE